MIIVDVFLKADITDSYLEAVDRLQRIRYIVVVIFAISCFFFIFSCIAYEIAVISWLMF